MLFVELSDDLVKALQEYKEAFMESYPLEFVALGSAAKDAEKIRWRIQESDPIDKTKIVR